MVAIPIAVGLYAWNQEPWERFGKLLVAAGFAWSLTTLAQSSDDVLYSAGRVFGWLVEPFLIYLVLAFPSGRLRTPAGAADRRRDRIARRRSLPPDDAARGLIPGAVPIQQLRSGLSHQRVHAAGLAARIRGRGDHAVAGGGDHAAVRRRARPARQPYPAWHGADAHHARAGAGVCDSPCGRPDRGPRCAARRAGLGDDGCARVGDRSLATGGGARVPGRALGLEGVREQGIAAARGRAGFAPAGAQPSRDVRASVRLDGSLSSDPSTTTPRAGWLGGHGGQTRDAPAGERRSLRHRGRRQRRSRRRGRARCGVAGRRDVPRRGAVLRPEGARERATRHGAARFAARAPGGARASDVERGSGAAADRTRPARRCAAVARRAANQARAGGRAPEGEPGSR